VGGALIRQNFWLFGWPVSLVFLPFAERSRRMLLLWALVAAEYAYRVIVPKTVVAATGPVYVHEIVPLLALISASGMSAVARRIEACGVKAARHHVAACVLAGIAVCALMFVPIHVRELHRSCATWRTVYRMLDRAGAENVLVFADAMVQIDKAESWAYYPPNPSPALDDGILFVRMPVGPDALPSAVGFWRRRFPDRSAWVFGFEQGQPVLRQLRVPAPGGANQ
jgi:hypothetical protein